MRRRSLPAVLAAVALAVVALGGTGCASSPRQTTVVRDESPGPGALSPTERGVVRREALEAARAGVAAWIGGDIEGMRSGFSTEQVAFFEKAAAADAAAGKVRVRVHKRPSLDVFDMSPEGTEVLATYAFTEASFYKDSSGKALDQPAGKAVELQLTLDKIGGRWLIVRMIGAKGVLK